MELIKLKIELEKEKVLLENYVYDRATCKRAVIKERAKIFELSKMVYEYALQEQWRNNRIANEELSHKIYNRTKRVEKIRKLDKKITKSMEKVEKLKIKIEKIEMARLQSFDKGIM